MYSDPVFINSLFFFDLVHQIAEFPVQRPAAASAAGQVQSSVRPVGGVTGESAAPIMKSFFAEVPGTALFYQMALDNGNIVFFLHVFLFMNFNFRIIVILHFILQSCKFNGSKAVFILLLWKFVKNVLLYLFFLTRRNKEYILGISK